MTMLDDRRVTRGLYHRAMEAIAAREAEQAAELARIEAERRERLVRYAAEAMERLAGVPVAVENAGRPERRPFGWELEFWADGLVFVLIDHDEQFPHLRLVSACPVCGSESESTEIVRDLADLGAALREADDPCINCMDLPEEAEAEADAWAGAVVAEIEGSQPDDRF